MRLQERVRELQVDVERGREWRRLAQMLPHARLDARAAPESLPRTPCPAPSERGSRTLRPAWPRIPATRKFSAKER
eukprot:1667038-Rhodomonas_salina.2